MYRPTLAKIICDYFKPSVVYDPCAGWGGRMIGAVASGSDYIGVEPCKETYDNLVNMAKFLGIESKVKLINGVAEGFLPHSDLVLTSPPYFNIEIYDDASTQSSNKYPIYSEWCDKFLYQVIKDATANLNGASCWNISNFGKLNLVDEVYKYHKLVGMTYFSEFGVTSSKRQVHGLGKKKDITYCFRR
jgi:hypothetical protein